MARVLLFNKPFGVLSQFTDGDGRPTLAEHISVPGVYAAGRLDKDTEGLMVLTDDGALQARISSPRFRLSKTYLAQVEGQVTDEAIERLALGVKLSDGACRPARVQRQTEPDWLWPREPPVRFRKSIPTDWLQLEISEGRNRQVRRMTAAVGFPTLRLIRVAIGPWQLDGLLPGDWREGDSTALKRATKNYGK